MDFSLEIYSMACLIPCAPLNQPARQNSKPVAAFPSDRKHGGWSGILHELEPRVLQTAPKEGAVGEDEVAVRAR